MSNSVSTCHFNGVGKNHSSLSMFLDVPNHDISVFHLLGTNNRDRAQTGLKKSYTPFSGKYMEKVKISEAHLDLARKIANIFA